MNEGKKAAIVRCNGSDRYLVTGVQHALTLDENGFMVISSSDGK
jgi:hypothetical protein